MLALIKNHLQICKKTHNTTSKKKLNMKNIFFSFLILSSNFIYSADIKTNVNNNKELSSSHKQKISSSSLDDMDDMDFDIQTLKEERYHLNEWKVLKGLAGLWLGTKLFFFGGKGSIVLLTIPDHLLSDMIPPAAALSRVGKLLTNRFLLLSLCSTLTVFSLWMLKKSVANIYQGWYGTENNIEHFDEVLV